APATTGSVVRHFPEGLPHTVPTADSGGEIWMVGSADSPAASPRSSCTIFRGSPASGVGITSKRYGPGSATRWESPAVPGGVGKAVGVVIRLSGMGGAVTW